MLIFLMIIPITLTMWIIFLFFTLFQNVSAKNTGDEHFFIVLDSQIQDIHGRSSPELEQGQAIARLEKQFPHTNFVVVQGSTNVEIKEKLKSYSQPNVQIDGLYIMSHGGNENLLVSRKDMKRFANRPDELISKKFMMVIANESSSFYVEPNDEESFNKVFSPIVGRLSPNAKIIFTGCSLLKNGTKQEKEILMRKIAKNFGLKSGSIYMNETEGNLLTRAAFEQPFYEQNGTGQKLTSLLIQALTPISLPILYLQEHLMYNRGYTLKINERESVLYEDNFFNAEKNPVSVGELKRNPYIFLHDIGETEKANILDKSVDQRRRDIVKVSEPVKVPPTKATPSARSVER